MSDYIYQNPIDLGYKQFKLTKQQHNKLFKYRQLKWNNKYEYYYNENTIILHRFCNMQGIILNTLLFPIYVLLHGFVNFKELLNEFKRMYNQKKYGSFISDHVSKGSNIYKEIMKII